MDLKEALKKHMAKKGAKAHPDASVKKMARGGKTNLQMKQLGRGMAKVANQKKPMSMVRKTGI
jgi:hypothetical protein